MKLKCLLNCVITVSYTHLDVYKRQGLLNVFDRLEVLEYSAKSVLAAKQLGEPDTITPEEVKEIEAAFQL